MKRTLVTQQLRLEHDVVLARQRARHIAELLGFPAQEQTRIATAVSEIARNAFRYAGGGRVEYSLATNPVPVFLVRITDEGPGISELKRILDGLYQSQTGMGLGILGAKRLMDCLEIDTRPGVGTSVTLEKHLPKGVPAVTASTVAQIGEALAREAPASPFAEVQRQNHELLEALDALTARQAEIERLNQELEETNRGVVALYTELDEKATSLQRASELKSRFLSNISHEFRTPLNAILSLSDMLLEGLDGELNEEQSKQVGFIRKGAEDLTGLVNDLLDLAKVEAGKLTVKPVQFTVRDLFGALRGMLRPLVARNSAVSLAFVVPEGMRLLHTDEGKVAQILRNFISNALKFTERGEVRVSAEVGPHDTVVFRVADTGIGIAAADHETIFEEFTQVEGPRQGHVKGTGLGLPLSRKLAELLGGSVSLESVPGEGSVFSVTLPRVYADQRSGFLGYTSPDAPGSDAASARTPSDGGAVAPAAEAGRSLLVIDDDEASRYLLKGLLANAPFTIQEAEDGEAGLRLARRLVPAGIFLDLVMPGLNGDEVLAALKADPLTRGIPVIMYTSQELEPGAAAFLATHAVAILSKNSTSRTEAEAAVRDALRKAGLPAALESDS